MENENIKTDPNGMPASKKIAAPKVGAWKCEMWDIGRPIPYGKNPRIIPEQAIAKIAVSIKTFGFRQPIVVDKAGVIVVGHTRLLGAKRLGMKKVPVHVAADLSDSAAKAYRIADNRVSTETSFDAEALGIELGDLKESEFDLGSTGFDLAEIEEYLSPKGATSEESDGETAAKTIKLTADQFAVVMSGIERLRASEGCTDKTMSCGRALELLTADWLAT